MAMLRGSRVVAHWISGTGNEGLAVRHGTRRRAMHAASCMAEGAHPGGGAGVISLKSSRLRVGGHVIDTSRRIVVRQETGPGMRLTVKALQVLCILVEQSGQVVSRESLFERVWPDTMPTDDVLTQAVAQLRKAFGDDRDAPRYIETITRGGYRLVAGHEWLPDEDPLRREELAPVPVATPTAAPTRPRAVPEHGRRALAVFLTLASIVVVAGVAEAWQWRQGAEVHAANPAAAGSGVLAEPPAAPWRTDYRAITSVPGQERWPNLSPDGTAVVYSQSGADGGGSRLMVQRTSHVTARALTSPPPAGSDRMPVWSRDGTRIAFVRTNAESCALMVIAANGGGERKVGDCISQSHSPFDWTPDGHGLVMGGIRNAGETTAPLRILDFASAQWRTLDYPVTGSDIDLYPHYSPDGRWLAFRRNTSLGDLWLMPAEGGVPPRRLTGLKGDIRGWDWLPDGSGLVFSLVRGTGRLYLYRLSDAEVRPLPPLTTGNALFPDIAAESWSMVFEIDQLRTGVFRVPLEGGRPAGELEQLFASSGADLLPAVAPDGRAVAFISDRAMSVQLWIGDPAHPDTLRVIAGLQPLPRHPPVWSPDGRKLLVVGRGADGDGLYEVDVGSSKVARLPVPDASPAYAAYTNDPQRLLVGVDAGQGRLRLVSYRLPSWETETSVDDVAVARYDAAANAVYFTRPSLPGLWRTDAGLHHVSRVDGAFPWLKQYYRQWGLVGSRIFYNGPYEGCQTAWLPLLREAQRPVDCLLRDGAAIGGSPSSDRAGAWLYLGLPLDANIDVGGASLAGLRAHPPVQAGAGRGEQAAEP